MRFKRMTKDNDYQDNEKSFNFDEAKRICMKGESDSDVDT